MEDPQERARISDTMRTTCADPGRKQEMSRATTVAWADPDKAARMGRRRPQLADLTPWQRTRYRRMQVGRNRVTAAEALATLRPPPR